jgi:hypothetical protein
LNISDNTKETKQRVGIRVAGLLDLLAAVLFSGAALPGAPKNEPSQRYWNITTIITYPVGTATARAANETAITVLASIFRVDRRAE